MGRLKRVVFLAESFLSTRDSTEGNGGTVAVWGTASHEDEAVSLTVLCSMQCYEQFIRRSPLGSCILFHEGGHWRELVVRTSQHGHTMAIVTFHPQQLGRVSGTGPAPGHPNGCHGALWAY